MTPNFPLHHRAPFKSKVPLAIGASTSEERESAPAAPLVEAHS